MAKSFGSLLALSYLCTQEQKETTFMGIYINKGNGLFRQARNSEYIDKSALIAVVNQTLLTEKRYTCVTRSRRFGKSMAAKRSAGTVLLDHFFNWKFCPIRNKW